MAKEAKNKKDKTHFFKDFKAELKKVIWPTPKQVANNTIAVITIVLITAVIVLLLDLVFESMNTYGINKLKEVIVKDNNTVVEGANTIDQNTITDENGTIANEISTEATIQSEDAENSGVVENQE